ncbi:MAG: hypothetical protein PHZ13_10845, partial [bacterium]|nr:hypothetical protein [bacterium]
NKLKQSDGSEKERRKAADNVVSEKYGVSLQELEKVSEMSETDQKQWALNIAEQMQSQAMNDPKAVMRKDDLKGAYKYWVGTFENSSPLDSFYL